MRYTQSQVRDLLAISVDDFRTWRRAIAALADHKGHAPSFTPGDVVALAIVAQLVRDFGLRIGTVSAQLDKLVQLCRGRSWVSLEACQIQMDLQGIRLIEGGAPSHPPIATSTITIPCEPIVKRLQLTLASHEADEPQGHLQFPPIAISSLPNRRLRRA